MLFDEASNELECTRCGGSKEQAEAMHARMIETAKLLPPLRWYHRLFGRYKLWKQHRAFDKIAKEFAKNPPGFLNKMGLQIPKPIPLEGEEWKENNS